ncbi:MAG: NeuD/PglB/VioB family sugar acetyltransferase [Janthinobacterium lividum]
MEILLIGGGGHCKSVIDVLESTGMWRISGIVERRGSQITRVLNYPVVGCDDELVTLRGLCQFALVTVGQITSPEIRIRLFQAVGRAGFVQPAIISSRAHVAATATLGAGAIVMHAAHIGPNAHVGANTIINTRALIEHDAVIGDHCHIATAAVVNGGAVVGDGCLIGSGAICREGITIGARSVVGMGARVLKTLPDGMLFTGVGPQ